MPPVVLFNSPRLPVENSKLTRAPLSMDTAGETDWTTVDPSIATKTIMEHRNPIGIVQIFSTGQAANNLSSARSPGGQGLELQNYRMGDTRINKARDKLEVVCTTAGTHLTGSILFCLKPGKAEEVFSSFKAC